MKILFINFNIGATAGINSGISIISSVLKERGHTVKLLFLCEELGYGMDLLRIKRDIMDFEPAVIGISLMETQSKYMERFCNDARSYYKGFVICGGPYPTMSPEDVLAVKGVDAVCVGEGEDAFLELVEALETGDKTLDIKNIWYKSPGGTVVRNRLRPFKNLKNLPAEDKELFDLDKILPIKNYQLEVMVGRGCRYRCSYCINMPYLQRYRKFCEKAVTVNDYVRLKDPDTVINEIKSAVRQCGRIKKIAFIDDSFLSYGDGLEDFLNMYKKEIGLPFMCNANPASFDMRKGRMVRDAGCDDVRFGVESGSERVKKDIMKRPISNRSVIEAFAAAKKLGLMTSSFNMIGLPTETKDEVLDTLRLNASIMPDSIKFMTFYPFKNTPIYDMCDRMEMIDHDKKLELDSYDTFTCLEFPEEYQLFLKKVQTAFSWYINIFSQAETAEHYSAAVKKIEGMNGAEWDAFDFYAADKEISEKLRKRRVPHYSKFVNRSLAVKFPSKHFN